MSDYCLLGAHVNTAMGGTAEILTAWKPPLVIVLDHSDVWHRVKEASPQTVFVGRLYQPYEPDFNRVDLDPLAAAQEHCDQTLPMAERMGETYHFWQGVNEPVPDSRAAMARYADFDAERARIMAGHGFRVVVGSFSVGNPAKMALWQEFLPALEAARQYKGALALHEYAWPTLDRAWPWYLLRHRKVYNGEPRHGWPGLPAHLKGLPLLITESGLDGGIVPGHTPRGWREIYSPDQYLQQLAWYDGELRKDPYVMGAAIYCCSGGAEMQWLSYDVWPEVAQGLAQRARPVYRSYDVELPKEDEPPTRPSPVPPGAEKEPGPRKEEETSPDKPELPVPSEPEEPAPSKKEETSPGTPEVPVPSKPEQPAPRRRLAPKLGTYPHGFPMSGQGSAPSAGSTADYLAPPPPPPSEEARLEGLLERLDRIIDMLRKKQ